MDRREARFWQRIIGVLHRNVFRRRVENVVGVGDPDVLLMRHGVVRQVELKFVNEPVRDTSILLGPKDGLNVDQINYHLDWAQRGGKSFVLVGTDLRVYLFPGTMASEVNSFTVAQSKRKSLISELKEFEEEIFKP